MDGVKKEYVREFAGSRTSLTKECRGINNNPAFHGRQTRTKKFHDRYAEIILRHKQRRTNAGEDTHLRSGDRRWRFCIGVVGWRLCAHVRHLCLLGRERGEGRTVTYTDIQSNDKRSNKRSSTEAGRPWSPVSYCWNFSFIHTAAMKYLCHVQGVVSELLFACVLLLLFFYGP